MGLGEILFLNKYTFSQSTEYCTIKKKYHVQTKLCLPEGLAASPLLHPASLSALVEKEILNRRDQQRSSQLTYLVHHHTAELAWCPP